MHHRLEVIQYNLESPDIINIKWLKLCLDNCLIAFMWISIRSQFNKSEGTTSHYFHPHIVL